MIYQKLTEILLHTITMLDSENKNRQDIDFIGGGDMT